MYQLYFNPPKSSWSLRIWILLKELNISFEPKIVRYLDDLNEQHKQFKNFSPTAKIPVLHANGVIIWDSLAITEFLAESYPQIWAEDKIVRAWSRSACAEMHSGFEHLRNICNFDPLAHTPLTEVPRVLELELERLNELLQQGLIQFGGNFLAGERFTAVDAFFVPVMLRIRTYDLHRYFSPQVLKYQDRILSLETLKMWLES
ncbi:Dichloromethane dehalogenase [Actinobacillus porcinus]|uniref:Dichloromethane dehalogenase n=1 Tax=Actinobacillus porcinus TaxID=51048 RepID=A0ABY6THB2_9PAST|nr:glutathione S-transferase N-terminal domain-containing protein [Actinobacillus porcinus]VFY92095.1 Dichloromethane dehalogenase [Actinobacillus porcinus]VTU05758.1 Dichloromethane dehalogenase [Actinobacillus porcinus]